jgi:hypothetical protein
MTSTSSGYFQILILVLPAPAIENRRATDGLIWKGFRDRASPGDGQLSDELQPGMLVRYDETTSRWFVAVVREVSIHQVEPEYLSGQREIVPAKKLTPFIP